MTPPPPEIKGCSRNYPGGHIFFSDPSTPRTHNGGQSPPTPRTRALINLPHYAMDQICLDPQDKLLPTPPPLGHTVIVNKTPSLHGTKKVFVAPPRIISGTALNGGSP